MSGLDLLERGGFFLWVLLVLSVVALALILERWATLWRLAKEVASLSTGRSELPERLRAAFPHTARLLVQEEAAEASLERCLTRDVHLLERRLTLIAVATRIAPMLGLLGTVSGLMKTFFRIEAGGGGVEVAALAQGIWEALITTVAGLLIAIVCLVAHQLLSVALEGCVLAVEEEVAKMTGVKTQIS